jgi:NAD(P)H dehydrogenase (quinone)
MFAITGITGKVGSATARALLDAGHQVRAIVRDQARGASWRSRGCEVAVADISDAPVLAEALAGAEGAFVLLPPVFDPAPGFADVKATIASIREALLRSAVPKAVVLSTIGADVHRPNLLNGLRFLEEALADLDMPIAFLRAAWFMENALWDLPSARDQGVIRSYLQPLDRPVPMVATDDVGHTAAALLQTSWTGHKIVELEAAPRISPNAIAAAFGKALKRSVEAESVPRAEWADKFRAEGMKNPMPRIQMLDGFNEGWIDFRDRGAYSKKGTTSIDQVIRDLVSKPESDR